MATNYPGGFDSLSNPSGTDPLDASGVPHASQHANANDAIEAIEATLGLNPQSNWPTVSDRIAAVQAGSITPGVITWTSPGVISVNSASDGLRITQTGAGNALVVEDSANPDATPFVVDASGNVGIGTTAPSQLLHVAKDSGFSARLQSSAGNAAVLFDRANTSIASPSTVASGDALGALTFRGYDGSAFQNAARIQVEVDTTPGSSDMPGRLMFLTTADGSATLTERMRITSAGNVGIGTSSPIGKLQVEVAGTGSTVYEALTLRNSTGVDAVTTRIAARNYNNIGSGIDFVTNGLSNFQSYMTFGTNDGSGYAEKVRIDKSGNVGIGTSSPTGLVDAYKASGDAVISVSGDSSAYYVARQAVTSTSGPLIFLDKARGTIASPSVVSSGDTVGLIRFRGHDGTAFRNLAQVQADVDGTPGLTDMPGRLVFSTTPDNSTTLTERMRIDNAGLITGTGTSLGAWTAYTPTLGGTGWAIGDGTVAGAWMQIGKLIVFRARIIMGTTSTYGASNSPTITLPTASAGAGSVWPLTGRILDASAAALYLIGWQPVSTTVCQLNLIGTSGLQSAITATVPFTFTTSDELMLTGIYQAA